MKLTTQLHLELRLRMIGTIHAYMACTGTSDLDHYMINTLRTGLLNCLNARSQGLTFRHCASCI